MANQAQTRTTDYVCYATWVGEGAFPIAPDNTYLFIDTTDTVPLPQVFDVYDPATGTWTYTVPA
jgi:hypothetical protein